MQHCEVALRLVEVLDDDPVHLFVEDLAQSPDGEPQEIAAALPGKDPDWLEVQLFQGDVRELGGLTGAVEDDTLGSVTRQVAEGFPKDLARATVDVDLGAHVVVREPALLS